MPSYSHQNEVATPGIQHRVPAKERSSRDVLADHLAQTVDIPRACSAHGFLSIPQDPIHGQTRAMEETAGSCKTFVREEHEEKSRKTNETAQRLPWRL